ncbi:MAG: HAMP domain-containing sensor histidine kinase [Acidobacteriota bacterium]
MNRIFVALVGIPGVPLEGWLRDPAHLAFLSLLLLSLGSLILILTLIPWLRSRFRSGEDLPPLVVPHPPPDSADLQPVLEAIQRRLQELERPFPSPADGAEEPAEDWSVLEKLPGAVVVLSGDRIRCPSRDFAERVGWKAADLAGERLRDFVASEDLLEVLDQLEALQRAEISRCEFTFGILERGRKPSGRVVVNATRVPYRRGEVTLACLRDAVPRPASVTVPVRAGNRSPISENPPEEDEAESRQPAPPVETPEVTPGAKTPELLANVAHELQTPLVTVKGYTEMILKGRLGPITVEQEKGLRTSLRNIDRLIVRIDELLGTSRAAADKSPVRPENFPLWEVIDEAIEMVQEKVLRKEVTMTTSYETEELTVRGNREQIQQLFTNLFHNAVKFNRDGGSVKVSVRNSGDGFLEVEVRDTGIGIPRSALPRIFDRFFRVEDAQAPKREGTGLGLSIVKRIVDEHGGTIRVESEVSVGTTFTLSLPCPAPGTAGTRINSFRDPGRISHVSWRKKESAGY